MHQADQDLFHELTFYTLAHPDTVYFIHQHAVDAFTAQTADALTKPVGLTFSLAGLCLFIEKNYSGRQVQLAHMKMAAQKRSWPVFILPKHRGKISVADVLAAKPGEERDEKLRKWCRDVWDAYHDNHERVRVLIRDLEV